MKKFLLSLAISSLFFYSGFAQSSYQSAIGGRLGSGYYDIFSASYKTFIASSPSALEFNLGFKPYSVTNYSWVNLSLAATYQYHVDIPGVDGLKWFVGGGLIGFQSLSSQSVYSGFGLGIYPTGGIDYKFSEIPLNLSVDLRPTFQVVKPYDYYDDFNFANFGIAARYTF